MEENFSTNIFVSSRVKCRRPHHRTFKENSQVVPDQAYTIRELYERSVVNSMPEVNQRKTYFDDEQDVTKLLEKSGIDLSTLDLTEIDEYKQQLQSYIDERKKSLQPKQEVTE